MRKILVIGGTGMIGKPVTRALVKAGFQVSMLARNPEKAQQLFPDVPIVPGDVFDPLSLLKAFEGQDAVYISLSTPRNSRKKDRMPEQEGLDNIIAVAQRTGIKRLEMISSLVQHYNGMHGFHWWILDIKQAAVEKLKRSGIPYTIFYPSSFMENFDQLMMKGNRIMVATGSKAPMYFIAADDYAQQVVRSFEVLTTENKEYPVQGIEALTWDEGAKAFMAHYTKSRLQMMKVPLGLLKLLGGFFPVINYGANILEAMNNYPEKFEAQLTWQELGKPVITIETYAAGL